MIRSLLFYSVQIESKISVFHRRLCSFSFSFSSTMVSLAPHLNGFPVALPPPLCTYRYDHLSIDLSMYLSAYLWMWLLTSLNTFLSCFILLQHTSNVRRFDQLLCLWVSAVGDISHIRLEVRFYSRIWSIPNTHILTARFVFNSFLFICCNLFFFLMDLLLYAVTSFIDYCKQCSV